MSSHVCFLKVPKYQNLPGCCMKFFFLVHLLPLTKQWRLCPWCLPLGNKLPLFSPGTQARSGQIHQENTATYFHFIIFFLFPDQINLHFAPGQVSWDPDFSDTHQLWLEKLELEWISHLYTFPLHVLLGSENIRSKIIHSPCNFTGLQKQPMEIVSSTKDRVLKAIEAIHRDKTNWLPHQEALHRVDNEGSVKLTAFQTLLHDQLGLMVDRKDRDVTKRKTVQFPTQSCQCDAAAASSPQMGTFRTWTDLRVFFEGTYNLQHPQVKILRIYQAPNTEQVNQIFDLRDPPLHGVNERGIPAGAQQFLFDDPRTKLYIFAEQSAHGSCCIFRIQVKAIVETNVLGSTLSDYYFSL